MEILCVIVRLKYLREMRQIFKPFYTLDQMRMY